MKTLSLVVLMMILVTGCGFVYPNVRPAEMTQREYANTGYRAGAEIIIANPFQATNVDLYIYAGNRYREELLLNVNGRNVVLKEYMIHRWIMNAVSSQHPTVKKLMLDVNRCYTVLRLVHWGIAGDFSVDAIQFCTSTDATRQLWRDGRGLPYYANVVMVLPGTDQAAMQVFNPAITVYPNNAGRQILNGILSIGR